MFKNSMYEALNKLDKNRLIVVAMSGGVDSSTVAALLKEQGFQVVGITLQLYDYGTFSSSKTCCAGQDIYDAKMVADQIKIPHYILNYESKFKNSVIDDFVESYAHGETPIPCVRCNQTVKFNDLLSFAKELNAQALVTGHYVRKIETPAGPEMHQGIDLKKDQSYFLFTTTKEQLDFLTFPLGHMTKEQTRNEAVRLGIKTADKPDSQGICFVPDMDYASLVRKLRPEVASKGKILHIDGYELGIHDGTINYTIGQRRGIGISSPEPLYVIKIDPQQNIVYVGPEKALDIQRFILRDINWLGEGNMPVDTMDLKIKIRSTHMGSPAKISTLPNGLIQVATASPEKAVAPGQACVFYDNTKVIGGGWIIRDRNS